MKIKLPKWSTLLGSLLAGAAYVVHSAPVLQQIPALQGNTLPSIIGAAGLFLAVFGTPPHANTPSGGVDPES